MTNKEYRKADGISRSDLFKIKRSPLHFKYEMENPPEPTPALIFGQALHKYILEPEGFWNEFAVAPAVDRRTKDGKAAWSEFIELSDGKTVISLDDFESMQDMSHMVNLNKYARLLLSGKHEQSFFWTDDMTGEKCKCRPDAMYETDEIGIIVDLKSCESAETESFMRDVVKFGYDMQAAMYRKGVEINTGKKWGFVFIAVEKKPPYAVNILQADDLIFTRGNDLFRELIGIYHNCKETGDWYGYNGFSGMINNLSLPRWLAREYE